MYLVYADGKVVAQFKETESAEAHALAKTLKEKHDDVWVELM